MQLIKCSLLLVMVLLFPILFLWIEQISTHSFQLWNVFIRCMERTRGKLLRTQDMDVLRITSTVKSTTLKPMLNILLGKENVALESQPYTNLTQITQSFVSEDSQQK